MAKKTKKKKRTPARWKKTRSDDAWAETRRRLRADNADGWELVWGNDHPGRVWPSKCPKCGKRLEAQIAGSICRTILMKDDGELGKQTDSDDVDLFYDNPTFVCTDWKKCGFEYEVGE